MTEAMKSYDAVVVGGGPAGATAAQKLAQSGAQVLLIDKPGTDQAVRRRHPAHRGAGVRHS
jgi:flavin-dependent dehydrogenase